MKYFLHDTSAIDDDKVAELFIKFGYEGIGLFYCILERIGKQEKPIKTDVLKSQLKVGKRLEKCWDFLNTIGLVSSNNGETFNERILSYNELYQVKKEKNREKISEWRKNQADKKNVTSYEPVRNQPKGKVIKEKVIKGTNNTPELVPAIVSDEFKKFLAWIEINAPSVGKMKEPFTEDQFFDIKKNWAAAEISEILKQMHNWQPLTRKNKNAYLTACKWLKKENGIATTQSLFAGNNGKLSRNDETIRALKDY